MLFDEGTSVVSKKILVTFPPQPLNEPLGPVTFTPGEEYVTIDVEFMANPVPLSREARWRVVPPVDTGADPVEIYAGNELGDGFVTKYSASVLNSTGHSVVASFTIYDPTYNDEDKEYALEVSNSEGEAVYAFRLTTRALLITTVPPVGEVPESKEGGVSGGTIAAIVIVVLIVIFGLVGIFWAKKNRKWCFGPYDPGKTYEK